MKFGISKKLNYMLVALSLLMTLLYVRVRMNMYQLSYEVNSNLKLERELTERNKKLKIEVESLKSPARIGKIASGRLNLKMDSASRSVGITEK